MLTKLLGLLCVLLLSTGAASAETVSPDTARRVTARIVEGLNAALIDGGHPELSASDSCQRGQRAASNRTFCRFAEPIVVNHLIRPGTFTLSLSFTYEDAAAPLRISAIGPGLDYSCLPETCDRELKTVQDTLDLFNGQVEDLTVGLVMALGDPGETVKVLLRASARQRNLFAWYAFWNDETAQAYYDAHDASAPFDLSVAEYFLKNHNSATAAPPNDYCRLYISQNGTAFLNCEIPPVQWQALLAE